MDVDTLSEVIPPFTPLQKEVLLIMGLLVDSCARYTHIASTWLRVQLQLHIPLQKAGAPAGSQPASPASPTLLRCLLIQRCALRPPTARSCYSTRVVGAASYRRPVHALAGWTAWLQ